MIKRKGFTLIELVAVIAILGALAVAALPRFINLQDEAEIAAAKSVAGAVGTAMANNYAASQALNDSVEFCEQPPGPNQYVVINGNNSTCGNFNGIDMMLNGAPFAEEGYTIDNTGCEGVGSFEDPGDSFRCPIADENGDAILDTDGDKIMFTVFILTDPLPP